MLVCMLIQAVLCEQCCEPAPVTQGDKAPDFVIPGESPSHLSDYLGKEAVLLAFYPRTFTSVCTEQMCGYRDNYAELSEQEHVRVIAISTDPQSESDRFKKEEKLPFQVIGDPDATIIKAYSVKLIETEKHGTIAERTVVLVDREGIIRYIKRGYDIKADAPALNAAIDALD